MPPSLPIELIQHILEHAVDILFTEAHDRWDLLSAVDPPVDFLLIAAAVHSRWLPLAQDLLLRHMPVDEDNPKAYLRRLEGRGEDFVSSIRFLRVRGWEGIGQKNDQDGWALAMGKSRKTTDILEKLVRALPQLREVEF